MSARKTTFAEFYYGLRAAYAAEDIINFVETSAKYRQDDAGETTDTAEALLLFEIGARSSWLVRTNSRLYKLIDDRKEDQPTINWSVSIATAQASDVRVVASKTTSNGKLFKIEFGFRQGREYLVDPKLFQGAGVEAAIGSFIGFRERSKIN